MHPAFVTPKHSFFLAGREENDAEEAYSSGMASFVKLVTLHHIVQIVVIQAAILVAQPQRMIEIGSKGSMNKWQE